MGWDQRLAYDIKYVENITFLGDVKIILKTIKKAMSREDIAIDTTKAETNLATERKEKQKVENNYIVH